MRRRGVNEKGEANEERGKWEERANEERGGEVLLKINCNFMMG
jgi:hypothetical protein